MSINSPDEKINLVISIKYWTQKGSPSLKILCKTAFFSEILQRKETVLDIPVWFICLQKKDPLKGCISIYYKT